MMWTVQHMFCMQFNELSIVVELCRNLFLSQSTLTSIYSNYMFQRLLKHTHTLCLRTEWRNCNVGLRPCWNFSKLKPHNHKFGPSCIVLASNKCVIILRYCSSDYFKRYTFYFMYMIHTLTYTLHSLFRSFWNWIICPIEGNLEERQLKMKLTIYWCSLKYIVLKNMSWKVGGRVKYNSI